MSPRLYEDSESSSGGQVTRRRSTPNNNNMSDDYFYSPASSSSSPRSTTNTTQETTPEPSTPNTEDSESRASEYHHHNPRDDRTYDLFKPYDRPAHEKFPAQAGEIIRQCMRSVSISSSSGDVEPLVTAASQYTTPPRRTSCVGWPHLSGGVAWGLVKKKKHAEPILTKEEKRTLMSWTWNEGVGMPERRDHHRPESPGGTRYDF
ncbi:uncharacterized protein L3040_000970 [Drepanopeziza brunnea f. sp. 'multigermtubi']|uniref:Uncharacterized protein n=1 Tax=Marssonina brunnea f. sp. multigermtubi (strain MB_m1) TaxID=1072389 RepID=K1XJJ8_MARBU|nr:uncharacterized protein MBM_01550 [Drepanopeziza brunnea f. sp. 'multigermtubi' MB_m1]EKD20868.1 hypothetical protein MBM_01550 [Drepanopeziza brunnea f. sp. 'multigermtubi' MB_m1]KAJ5054704.1 hypothetical protein L3040_000970 [Drepanopeziza brunnea f. sp. 'multigermtubi']